jgi:hypothetical protein
MKDQRFASFSSLADLVVFARSYHPIPSRTRPLNSSAPMVLSLKAWKSRSLPGLPRTKTPHHDDGYSYSAASNGGRFVCGAALRKWENRRGETAAVFLCAAPAFFAEPVILQEDLAGVARARRHSDATRGTPTKATHGSIWRSADRRSPRSTPNNVSCASSITSSAGAATTPRCAGETPLAFRQTGGRPAAPPP